MTLAEIRNSGVAAIAPALGLSPTDMHARAWTPCPACGAETRGSRDPRGPVGVTADGLGWRCLRCRAGGDAVSLAALVTTGTTSPASWAPVLDRQGVGGPTTSSNPNSSTGIGGGNVASRSPIRPPLAEVRALWSASRPVSDDDAVSAWLVSRGLSPDHVDLWASARALPPDATLPPWASIRRTSWTSSGHRLLLPLVDPTGGVVSLRARRIVTGDDYPKEIAPAGYSTRGLVYADPLARGWLSGSAEAAAWVQRVGLVVVEGGPDYLAAMQLWVSDADEEAPAIVGIGSGAWTAAIAERVSSDTRVTVVLHGDEAGERYCERIADSLRGRAHVAALRIAEVAHGR